MANDNLNWSQILREHMEAHARLTGATPRPFRFAEDLIVNSDLGPISIPEHGGNRMQFGDKGGTVTPEQMQNFVSEVRQLMDTVADRQGRQSTSFETDLYESLPDFVGPRRNGTIIIQFTDGE